MRQVITILFLSICGLAYSQSLIEDTKSVVSEYCAIVDPSDQAERETQTLMNAYFFWGEEGLDQYLNMMDDSWYGGIDVYLGDDHFSIVDLIRSDQEAEFRLNGKATVTVADDGVNYIVVIYSFP